MIPNFKEMAADFLGTSDATAEMREKLQEELVTVYEQGLRDGQSMRLQVVESRERKDEKTVGFDCIVSVFKTIHGAAPCQEMVLMVNGLDETGEKLIDGFVVDASVHELQKMRASLYLPGRIELTKNSQ